MAKRARERESARDRDGERERKREREGEEERGREGGREKVREGEREREEREREKERERERERERDAPHTRVAQIQVCVCVCVCVCVYVGIWRRVGGEKDRERQIVRSLHMFYTHINVTKTTTDLTCGRRTPPQAVGIMSKGRRSRARCYRLMGQRNMPHHALRRPCSLRDTIIDRFICIEAQVSPGGTTFCHR